MVEEAALSRVYAGIHYQSDNEARKQIRRQLGDWRSNAIS
jgi:hypothetical protein